ncbi:MAG: monovalent cation/H+ antiporter subunit D family protein, partial [Desulfobacteraceae bacterium]
METVISIKPLLAVLVTLVVIPILISSSARPNVRESWIFIAGIIKLCLVLSMLPVILEGKQIALILFEIAP